MVLAACSFVGGFIGVVRGRLLGAGWGFGLTAFWLFPYLGWNRLIAGRAAAKPPQMVQRPAVYWWAIAFFGGSSIVVGAKSIWLRTQHDSTTAVAGFVVMTAGLLFTALIVVTYVRDRRGLVRPKQDRDHGTVRFWIDNPTPPQTGTLSEDVPADACGDGTYRIAGPPWSIDGIGVGDIVTADCEPGGLVVARGVISRSARLTLQTRPRSKKVRRIARDMARNGFGELGLNVRIQCLTAIASIDVAPGSDLVAIKSVLQRGVTARVWTVHEARIDQSWAEVQSRTT
jgi:hypothetical protein